MKNKLKLAIIAAFSVAGAIGLWATNSPKVSAASVDLSSPRTLYVQNCARCHGGDGKGNTPTGKKLDAADLTGGRSVAGIARVVKNGKGKMPAFGKRLSAKQIADIAGYVHSL